MDIHALLNDAPQREEATTSSRHSIGKPHLLPQPIKLAPHLLDPSYKYPDQRTRPTSPPFAHHSYVDSPASSSSHPQPTGSPTISPKRSISALIHTDNQPLGLDALVRAASAQHRNLPAADGELGLSPTTRSPLNTYSPHFPAHSPLQRHPGHPSAGSPRPPASDLTHSSMQTGITQTTSLTPDLLPRIAPYVHHPIFPGRADNSDHAAESFRRSSAASLSNIINHDHIPPSSPSSSTHISVSLRSDPIGKPISPVIPSGLSTLTATQAPALSFAQGQSLVRKRLRSQSDQGQQPTRRPQNQSPRQPAPSGSLDIAASEPLTSAKSVLKLDCPSRTPSPTPEAQAQSLALHLGPIPTSRDKLKHASIRKKRSAVGSSELDALLDDATKPDDRMDVDDDRVRKPWPGSSRAGSSTRPTPDLDRDRASMPPPTQRPAKRKKESATKAVSKKPPAKPRAKAAAPRAKKVKSAEDGPTSVPGKRLANGASRSRSTSVIPGETEVDPKSEDDKEENNRLYCICRTPYNEDKVMIACDRCDEWYHTQCLNTSDLEVELVDQFICPVCVEKNPHLPLQTTYKRRCLHGLTDPDPSSASACHKPARGALSKYCSDECGIKNMQRRIDTWTSEGGDKDQLWQMVKDAERREGVVVLAGAEKGEREDRDERAQREIKGMNALLDRIVKTREQVEDGMDVLEQREVSLGLAVARAQRVDQCGWDHRLCYSDDEWRLYGPDIPESYEADEDGTLNIAADWWCNGPSDCSRHAGWANLRHGDVRREREMKQQALANLTTREREVRGRIEDALDPQTRIRAQLAKVPLGENIPSGLFSQPNGDRKKGINGRKKKP